MNETLKTIYEIRAVRKYSDKLVDKEIISQIIDAGRMAPSAINMQPWKFYVLTKQETIEMFSYYEVNLCRLLYVNRFGLYLHSGYQRYNGILT